MNSAEILSKWLNGATPERSDYEQLWHFTQQHQSPNSVFDQALTLTDIVRRSKDFLAIAPDILELCLTPQFTDQQAILTTLWSLWLPLAQQIRYARQQQDQPFIQGILGSQGTGKTTLCRILQFILQRWHYPCLSLSLDDLYKTYGDRQALQQTQPELIWRGPPGTHDVELGIEVLTQLQQANLGDQIALPRFDKSLHNGAGDRLASALVDPAEIIFFEGWFVGCQPIEEHLFDHAPEPILTTADQAFAKTINQALKKYLPLWEKLDSLIVISPEDYRLSKQWRKDAEHQMIAQGKTGMTDHEIDQFVDYFWRSLHPELFIQPLKNNSNLTDFVIEIDADHRLSKIYRPNPA